jgi:hypothetical protein
MITPLALADTSREVITKEIDHDAPIVAELLDYIRWLADQDSSFPFTAGHVWTLYFEGVRRGRVWSEICEDIGLPVREDWS